METQHRLWDGVIPQRCQCVAITDRKAWLVIQTFIRGRIRNLPFLPLPKLFKEVKQPQ